MWRRNSVGTSKNQEKDMSSCACIIHWKCECNKMTHMAKPDFHDGKEIPMSVADLQSLYHILHDEILLRGNEHMTMFLMDLKTAWRNGELDKFRNLE